MDPDPTKDARSLTVSTAGEREPGADRLAQSSESAAQPLIQPLGDQPVRGDQPVAPTEPSTQVPPSAFRLRPFKGPFAPLRHRNYRLLWFGTVVSNTGDWMDQIALNWLVLTLTGSPIYLGLLQFCRGVPIIAFTLIGGAVADRVERRRLMIVTQSSALIMAVALGFLALFEGSIWLVLAIATARGVMFSFNLPARQALISELVPRDELTQAVSLNSATLNLCRMLGPVVGGILIALVGVAGTFFINALTFVAVIYGLFQMTNLAPPAKGGEPVWRSIVSGLSLVWHEPALRSLIFLALVPFALSVSYQAMLPVFAKDIFDVGSIGLGAMASAAGIGSVVGALGSGMIGGNVLARGRLMFVGLVLFGSALVGFALSGAYLLSLGLLVLVGLGQASYQTLNNSLIQQEAPDAMRGRVISILFLVRGIAPLGAMVAAFSAELFSAPTTIVVAGIGLVVIALTVAASSRAVRELA